MFFLGGYLVFVLLLNAIWIAGEALGGWYLSEKWEDRILLALALVFLWPGILTGIVYRNLKRRRKK